MVNKIKGNAVKSCCCAMRCIVYLLNLVVKTPLKLSPVGYNVQKQQGQSHFLSLNEKLETKKTPTRYVETKWNSTFQMLELLQKPRKPVGALVGLQTHIPVLTYEQ
ncbi:hypothetical protein ILYODFUR_029261 [Ilyodon furcidens]|uniref:Uncharacterized protein n=1 Tax=Ilyodon furcidens TaxID=33524 RepID=A0ABV0U0G3_9TELE